MFGADDDAVGAGVEEVLHQRSVGGLAVHGDGEGLRVAAAGGGQSVQLAAAVFHFGGRDAIGQPAVAPGGDSLEHPAGQAAQDHRGMGLLDGLGVAFDGREVVVGAVVLGFVLRPEFLHCGDGFAGLRPAVVEVAAENLRFLPVPAGADAKEEASAADAVEGSDFFGQQQGVAFRHQGDAGAEFDGAGGAGSPGQGDVGVGEVGVSPGDGAAGGELAGALHGQNGMLGVPDGFKAEGFGGARHKGRVQGVGGQGYGNANGHNGFLLGTGGS